MENKRNDRDKDVKFEDVSDKAYPFIKRDVVIHYQKYLNANWME